MIKELVDYLLDIAYKHISVQCVGYAREININDSHNHKSFQFIVENDTPIIEKQIIEGILTLRFSVDIIGFVDKDKTVIELQDEALHIALDWMQYINNHEPYNLEIRDYSILALTEYTDDNSSGVRLSVKLAIPNPINLCEYEEHFIEKEIPEEETLDLTNGDECTKSKFNKNDATIKLNPIKIF